MRDKKNQIIGIKNVVLGVPQFFVGIQRMPPTKKGLNHW
jgi:hypothetical protein